MRRRRARVDMAHRGLAKLGLTAGIAAVLPCAPRAAAQDGFAPDPVVYKLEGRKFDELGRAIVVLGDVDRDGVNDFAASLSDTASGEPYSGQVNLYSGKDGKLLRSWRGPEEGTLRLGFSGLWAMPDLDADGVPELGMSSPRTGIHIYSPVTGKEWYALTAFLQRAPYDDPGSLFVRLPDMDGDGIEEVAAGSSLAEIWRRDPSTGRIAVYSGRTGAILWVKWRTPSFTGFGAPLTLSGDHDGDGFPDLLTNEGYPRGHGEGERPGEVDTVIRVVSSRTGEILRSYFPPGPRHFGFGAEIVPLGDWDGNGFPEVAISAPLYREGPVPENIDGAIGSNYGRFRGWVGVFKLPGFELVYSMEGRDPSFTGFEGDIFGSPLSAAGDVDGDGTTDLLIGTERGTPSGYYPFGRLYLCSGKDGSVLATYAGLQDSFSPYFQRLRPLGDLDGDGRAEFIAGHPSDGFLVDAEAPSRLEAGSITVLRYDPRAPRFSRGDVNADSQVNLADAAVILRYALAEVCYPRDPVREPEPGCLASYDIDGNGCIDLRDGLSLLHYLFRLSYSPEPPFPGCGRFFRLKPKAGYRDMSCKDPGLCAE